MAEASSQGNGKPLLDIIDLKTYFHTDEGTVTSVDGVSFDARAGETVGVVGESGCGKSVTALSVMRLIPVPPGERDESPEDVTGAVVAAFEAGAQGVVLSRKYSEMRLDNLAGCGEALRRLGCR